LVAAGRGRGWPSSAARRRSDAAERDESHSWPMPRVTGGGRPLGNTSDVSPPGRRRGVPCLHQENPMTRNPNNLPQLERPVRQLGESEADHVQGGARRTCIYIPYVGTAYKETWFVKRPVPVVNYYRLCLDI